MMKKKKKRRNKWEEGVVVVVVVVEVESHCRLSGRRLCRKTVMRKIKKKK